MQQSNQEQQQQEKSSQSQIQDLEQQLQQAKSSLLQQQLSEQSLQSKIQEIEQLRPGTIVSAPKIVSKTEEVELISEKEIDYTKLRNLLQQRRWSEAEGETDRVMLLATNTEIWSFKMEDLLEFTCQDLRTIDNLWLHYSDGKFGFSVQKEIYESLGGTESYEEEIWNYFGYYIGWRQRGRWMSREDKDKMFSQIDKAPLGYFPAAIFYSNLLDIQGKSETLFVWMIGFFSRIKACKL